MKYLCKLKYYQEMTKYEVNFLKEKTSTHRFSHPFECESMVKSFSTIQTSEIRQELYQQYKTVAEQARNYLMTISMECAQQQKQHYHKEFETAMKEMWEKEKTLPYDHRLTIRMQQLLQQRFDDISARIECLYKFKMQLFCLRSHIH